MGLSEKESVIPQADLETVNSVTIASCAIQQLPKLLHALGNMARRSRRQLHRRGIFLGGCWLEEEKGSFLPENKSSLLVTTNKVPAAAEGSSPKRKGILKNDKEPSLDHLSAYNEFWKTYSFSFSRNGYTPCSKLKTWNDSPSGSYPFDMSPRFMKNEDFSISYPTFSRIVSIQNLQNGLYKPQTLNFMDSFPTNLTSLKSLQNILFRHLTHVELNPQEQEILLQLQYLKILFNTPLHKLVRERPKEFLVPLPKRHSRISTAANVPYYARSLTAFQTVATFPEQEQGLKLISYSNIFGVGGGIKNELSDSLLKRKRRTVPKGVAFITYPDSVDETSFEGTIGGRNIISFTKETTFPQMGIDQSHEFKVKKEMGRQQMIQSRLRAARVYRRIYCDKWNNYANGNKIGAAANSNLESSVSSSNKNRGGPIKRNKSVQHAMQAWFKLAQIKQSLQMVKESLRMRSSGTATQVEEESIAPQFASTTSSSLASAVAEERRNADANKHAIKLRISARKRSGRRAERRRRIKICLITIAKYLSCGLIPYIMKGECKIFRRKRVRRADSRERCPTPPLPILNPDE